MRKIKWIPIMFLAFTLNSGCQVKSAIEVVALAKAVIELVNSFSLNNNKLTILIKNVVHVTAKSINNNENQTEIASFWTKYWLEINQEYRELKTELSVLENKATMYFFKLESNNALIINETLKYEDNLMTQQLKERWSGEYEKALQSLSTIEDLLKSGNDYQIILENNAGRAEIVNSISALKDISAKADLLALNIKSFQINSNFIFGSKNNFKKE